MREFTNRAASLLLALLLTLALSPAALAAGTTDVANGDTCLRTSYNENNYLELTIDGDRLTVSGRLIVDGLTSVWVELDGESNDYETFSRSSVSVASGEAFSVTKPLSSVTGPTALTVFTKLRGAESYWSYLWNRVYIEKAGSGWRFLTSPVLENNLAFANQWVNPADYLGTNIAASVKKLSDQIVGGETNDYQKLFLLHKWVAENIYYDYDAFYGSMTTTYGAEEILTSKRSVCEGYANLLRDLIRAQGIPAMKTSTYALGVGTSGGSFAVSASEAAVSASNHAHVEAYVDGRWVTMDATWDSNNRYENGSYVTKAPSGYYYFDISSEAFAIDHKIIDRGDDALYLANGAVANRNTAENGKKPSAWAIDEAGRALSLGLIPNALQGSYQSDVSREAFCHLIVNMLRVRENAANNTALLAKHGVAAVNGVFSDTADDDVLTAYRLGIVGGVGDNRFEPGRGITRQEAAVMLQRAANVMGLRPQGAEKRFSDLASAADWAKDGIRFVSSLVTQDGSSVMGGAGDSFAPQGGYTVEQSILTVYRLYRCA